MTTPTPYRVHPRASNRALALIAISATCALALIAMGAAWWFGWFVAGTPTTGDAGPTPSSQSSTAVAEPPTAAAVLARLATTGVPISNPLVQDETTDPNKLLGRPNGYLSRASFDIPGGDLEADPHTIGRGGVIEVYTTEAAARARAAYLQETSKAAPILGTEYDYVRGPVLLRITGDVTPSVAAQFEAAFLKA